MTKPNSVVTLRMARTTINTIKILCDPCHPDDYEPECVACQAGRLMRTIEAMIADGDIQQVPHEQDLARRRNP